MTTLDGCSRKILVREAEGKAFRYTPRLSREELHREAAGQALRQLLDASPRFCVTPVVSCGNSRGARCALARRPGNWSNPNAASSAGEEGVMFAARGIAVSLSVFAFLYVTLSLAAGLAWQRIWFYSQRLSARRSANLLFAWRMFPLVITLPSHWRLPCPRFFCWSRVPLTNRWA